MTDLHDKDLEKVHVDFVENVAKPEPSGPVLVDETGRIQRLPVPSDDPNDPLNFAVWEKTAIIVCCCWFSIMSLSVVGGLGSVLDVFFQLYGAEGRSTNQVVWLSTFPSLFVGLLPLMLAELTFVHQRGTIYGIYWASQNIITSLLTLGSSYEVAALGWRWFYWVFVLTVGVGLVLVVFGCFETRYQRGAIFLQNQAVITDEYGVTRVLNEEEARAWLAAQTETSFPGAPSQHPPTKRSYRQMLSPWPGVSAHPMRTVLKTWWQMLESFSSPGVLYATLLASVVLGASVGVSLTYNTVLEYNYGWSASAIGLINLGGVFGGLGGMLYAGIFGDRFIVWAAKRAGGVHQPEHHLLLLIAPGLLAVASLILYGFTADGNATWGGPFMGWTLYQVAFVSVLIRTTSFATEAWPKNPGPALVTVVGTKNLISFGVSYGLNPMVAKYSYPAAMGILAGVVGGVLLLGVPVYFYNPKVCPALSFVRL
ncbi:hypothetical protein ASPACDRAFT_1908671 [Aspergillus aculeatus ATCC 16872]|uniref:Major facilitator superfamily (MFS) profile domain-containing protein n=1 Tax=Aspergillus aculeatus (strain ATCC 16872 / CBS 172.66 / WB 5094) TaxID=690307 RepID=A0A1L9WFN8_ASPA1|nr:uncharacterized protein ASPACDRAFT_1908671 [Aspergillus aculeatus ATCC 16872]OJJ94979.1 hypothetical protein ASPACDRAFT_1908671 [Aspergillus aculeatus ATCC 16872]